MSLGDGVDDGDGEAEAVAVTVTGRGVTVGWAARALLAGVLILRVRDA